MITYTMTVQDPEDHDFDYPIRVEQSVHKAARVDAHIKAVVSLLLGASFAEETILRGIEDWLEDRVRDPGKENGQAVHVNDCSVGLAESVARSKMMEMATRGIDSAGAEKENEGE
jgi:hypothetical protein